MRILLIDDEENLLVVLADELTAQGFDVLTTSNPLEAYDLVLEYVPDVVVTDLRMEKMDGICVTKQLQKEVPDIPVIVLTAFGDLATAVDAIKAGALDYCTKPVDPDEFQLTLKRVVQEKRRERENLYLRDEVNERLGYVKYLGVSAEADDVRQRIERAAASDVPVVLSGESGTGKELVARLIHLQSDRACYPFLSVNCREESNEFLLEEIFGRPGQHRRLVKSKLEVADGGSIMLDEITALSIELQSRLLRTIESGLVEPGGGRRPFRVNVRFFFTTSESLQDAISDGRLSSDLYHRINVVTLQLPALAQRQDDIPILVRAYIESKSKAAPRKNSVITDTALEALVQYEWPGNVRELYNVLEGALVMSIDGQIKLSDLPSELIEFTREGQSSTSFLGLREKLLSEERRLITRALEKNSFIQRRAALSLGVSRSLLNQKIKKLGIEISREK